MISPSSARPSSTLYGTLALLLLLEPAASLQLPPRDAGTRSQKPLLVASRHMPLSMIAAPPLAASAAIIGAANGLGFGISLATGWHYHLDLIGTGCFAISALAISGSAPVQRLSAAAVGVWASKLAGFLFYRVLQTKHDARLTDVLATSTGAFGFWFISFAWGWFVSLPHTLAAGVEKAPPLGACSALGLGMFVVGLVIETLADVQKWRFKQNPATARAFCDAGVWKLCQHPNWFGNLLLWSGIALLNAPTLLAPSPAGVGWLRRCLRLGAASLSPLFMLGLFNAQATGAMGNAVELAAKRYGADPRYQAYLDSTPLLFPTIASLRRALTRR